MSLDDWDLRGRNQPFGYIGTTDEDTLGKYFREDGS